MSCPMYEDFTRGCVTKFIKLLPLATFDFCESEHYDMCPFYKVITTESQQCCDFIEKCCIPYIENAQHLLKKIEKYRPVLNLIDEYCLTDNKTNCARYKFLKAGKKVPMFLLSDGSKLKMKEILLK